MADPVTPLTTAVTTQIVTTVAAYAAALRTDDSLAGAWKRNLNPGVAETSIPALEEPKLQADLLAAIATNLGVLVVSGCVVTDHGASNSKVDVAAGVILTAAGLLVTVAAVSALATLDGKTIQVSPAGVISSATGLTSGNITLGTISITTGVCTVTDTRLQITKAVIA